MGYMYPLMDDTTQKTLLARVEELSAVTGDCVAGLLIASERAKELTASLQMSLADSNRTHDATAHVAAALAEKMNAVSSAFAADMNVLRTDIAKVTKTFASDSELLVHVKLAVSQTSALDGRLRVIQQADFASQQKISDLIAAQTQELGARMAARERLGEAASSSNMAALRAFQLENRYYFWAVIVLLLAHFAR